MADYIAQHNIKAIYQGDTYFRAIFKITDPGGFDFSQNGGTTAKCQFKVKEDDPAIITFEWDETDLTVTVAGQPAQNFATYALTYPSVGEVQIQMFIPKDLSELLAAGTYIYDVEYLKPVNPAPNQHRITYFRGSVVIEKDITE